MMSNGNGYTYNPKKGRFTQYGVPARDLTQHEYERLSPRAKRAVHDSGAYTPKRAPSNPKSEPKSNDAPADGGKES